MSRLWENLMRIGSIGENPDGSITRLCFSEEYFESVRAVKALMEEAGMETSVDSLGNLRGRLDGTEPSAGTLVLGSHLDTVKCGGKFDGCYGVLGAVECALRLREEGIHLRHSLEIWGFNMEESNPMGGMLSSQAVVGIADLGRPGLAEKLGEKGRTIQDVWDAQVDFSQARCFLELHIEQGDRLYTTGHSLGIVSGIVGITRYQVTVKGQSNHAGTTMMSTRRDALVAASRLMVQADQYARDSGHDLVLTFGTIACQPNVPNVIPGQVVLELEVRARQQDHIQWMVEKIREIASQIPRVSFTIEKQSEKFPVDCSPKIMDAIRQVCCEMGYDSIQMPSGALHDAHSLSHAMPIGMIFVPSRDGISHSGLEWTSREDVERGADALYRTVLLLDRDKSNVHALKD